MRKSRLDKIEQQAFGDVVRRISVRKTFSDAEAALIEKNVVRRIQAELRTTKGGQMVDAILISELSEDFEKHGPDAIRRMREENPVDYLRLCGSFATSDGARKPILDMSPEERDAQFEELIRKGYPQNCEKILKLMREDEEARHAPLNRKTA